jgi:hypothetical protein
LYAYHASEIMKAIRKLVHGYNVIEDAFRRTTSKDNKVRLLTIRRLKYILSHLYTVLMEIEMVGKVRDPALQGIPSMEGITNKSVLSTLKIAPTPWEAFWRSGRKRYYDIYAEDLKGPSRTTLLEERRARSREYSKKKYEYIVESKKGAEIYKKEVEYNGRTGVCRICSKKNIPIKKLEEHNKNCKKIEDIKEELLKLNELLMIECKKAGEMKENTYKLTSKPNAPSKKKTEVKHQEADKKDKLDKQDTTMTTAKSGNTFANSIAPSFVSDRKLIVDKKFENKATVDSSQIKRANSGERIEDLTAQNDATIKSVNSAFVPSNLKDTRREEPRSEPLRFIHTKLDVHDNDNQPSTIQEEHIDASHQDNPNEIKNLNSQVKFAEHSNDNLHDIHSPEHTHKSAPAGANVSNDDHSNHFTQSGNDFSEDSSEEERENKKNFKPSRFCNYNTSKQKKDAKNNYSQLPLSPVQDQSNDDTDKFQKAVMDSSPGTANMSKSRISQAADSPLQFKKEEPRKSIEIKPVPTASTHQENKKPQEPQDDEKPTIGDMFDPSEDSSKSEQSSGGSDNRDKTTVPKRSGFLLEKIDREQKEKAAEQRRLQEEQEEALRKKAYEEAAKKSMMEEEKKEVRCEADKPIFKNKLAEQPKTPELAPAIVPATRVEGNNSSKKEKKKNEEVFVGDMLLDDDDDEDDDEEDDADSDSSHVDEELITAPKNNGLKKSNFGTMITQPIVKNQSNEKDKQKENLQEAPNFIAGLMEDSDNDADQDKKSDKSKSKLNSSRSQVKTPTSVDNPPSIPQREREISEPIFSFGKGASIINKRGNDSDGSADKNADSVPNSGGSTLKILDLVQFGRKSPHPDTRSQPVKPDSDQASKMSGDSKQPDPVQVNLSQKEQLKKFRSVARQPQFETQILEKEEKIKPKPKHHEEEEVSAHPVTAQKDNEFLMVKIAKDLFGEIAQYGEAIKRHPFGDQSLNRETSLINMLKQIINNDEFYFDDVKQFSKGILAKVDRRFHLIREINVIFSLLEN